MITPCTIQALAAEAGVAPDLNQDSDDENQRVRGSNEQGENDFDPPVLFYGKPFRRTDQILLDLFSIHWGLP